MKHRCMQWWRIGMRWGCSVWIPTTVLIVAVTCAQQAHACEPPFTGWFVDGVVPADEQQDAPINGVVAVRLQFVDGYTSTSWPDEDRVEETVVLELTRDGDEVVPGIVEVDRVAREVRFVSERLLAEGITYTLRVELRNDVFEDGDSTVETLYTFTTGANLDEVPPAFSGLLSLEMTESARSIDACCEAPEEQCPCSPSCQWCWTVGWDYKPLAQLSWRAAEDEFGFDSVNYLLYRLDNEMQEPSGEPLIVYRGNASDSVSLVIPDEDPEPWCFTLIAQDIYGRVVDPGRVLCGTQRDIAPIERLAVPQPDRSGCLEQGDAGMDGSDMDGGDDTNSGTDDTGTPTPDSGSGDGVDSGMADAEPSDGGITITMTGDTGDGCGCRVVGPRRTWPGAVWWALVGLVVGAVAGRSRRG